MSSILSFPASDLPSAEFVQRLVRLRKLQQRLKLDAILIATQINRYYFTGLQASNGLLLSVSDREPVFYTDSRYLTMARNRLTFLPVKMLWRSSEEADRFSRLGRTWARIGYEGTVEACRIDALRAALPAAEWCNISSDIHALRSVKSKAEQQVIRTAVRLNDAVFARVRPSIHPGMREWDVRNLIHQRMDACGQGEAFDTIVCAGRNGAECHHASGMTRLRDDAAVLIDMGLKFNHYCSDMTRSFCLGRATALYREIYALVLAANRKAIRAIRPGRSCCEIDALARRPIEQAGYGRYFIHGLGHSLGLEIHETPNFSEHCKTSLKPGMILTVEPGIYLPGKFGIRIEDVVLVTRTGCEVLTQTAR